MRKALRWSTIVVFSLLLVLTALGYWLLATQSGFKWVLGQAKPNLSVTSIKGHAGDFTLTGVTLDLTTAQIDIDRLAVSWTRLALLSGQLNISNIKAKNVSLTLHSGDEQSRPYEPWQGIELPVNLMLNNLHVEKLELNSDQTSVKKIEKIHAAVTIIDNELFLESLKVSDGSNQVDLSGQADLSARADGVLAFEHKAIVQLNNETVSSVGQLSGTWSNLVITQSISAPLSSELNIDVAQALSAKPSWRAELSLNEINSGLMPVEMPSQRISGLITSTGSMEINKGLLGLEANLSTELNTVLSTSLMSEQTQPLRLLLNSKIEIQNNNLSIENLNIDEGSGVASDTKTKLRVSGLISEINTFKSSSNSDSGRVQIVGTWSELGWPLGSAPKVIPTTSGSFSVLGPLKQYDIKANAQGHGRFRDARFNLNGVGSKNDLNLRAIDLTSRKGKLFGKGEVSWAPKLSWDTQFSLEHFNAEVLSPNWPSDLSGRLSSHGELVVSDKPNTGGFSFPIKGRVEIAELKGQLRDRPVSLNVAADINNSHVDIRRFELASGTTLFKASGVVGDDLDLVWSAFSPDLSDLHPEASGQLKSEGLISGDFEEPTISGEFESEMLSFGSWSSGKINLNFESSFADENSPLEVTAAVSEFGINESLALDKFDLSVSGSHRRHTVNVFALSDQDAELQLKFDGGRKQKTWSGELSSFELDTPESGRWSLASETPLSVSEDAVFLQASCLQSGEQSLCFSAQKKAGLQTASAKLSAFDLSSLSFLTAIYDIDVEGLVNGNLVYRQRSDAASPELTASLSSNDVRVAFPKVVKEKGSVKEQVDGETDGPTKQLLNIDSLLFELNQTNSLNANWSLTLDNGDRLSGNLEVQEPLGTSNFQEAVLLGELALDINDLSVVPKSILPNFSVNGRLDAGIQLSGSVADPELGMRAQLTGATFAVDELGLDLTQIELSAITNKQSVIDLSGSLKSGDGKLNIVGTLDLSDIKNPSVNMALRGDDLTLAQSQAIGIVGSINTQLTLDRALLDVRGKVDISSANIDYSIPESVLTASDDVVLLGDDRADEVLRQRLDLTLNLGRNTTINAAGLEAMLTGGININQEPGGIPTGQGQIDIRNGRYKAYGQDLAIDRGRLIFSGSSIDDPSLDLSATKTIDTTTVGVNVSGRAQSPRLSLFSNPSMTDQNILSVLIFGKSIEQLGSKDSLTLLRIASSLRGNGPGQLARITDRLQSRLGLTDLQLQLDGSSPSILAGRQLSSKFYVGYGYGLLDAAQSVILRYKINKAWSIQGDLGADSGADLRYQIER